MDCVTVRKSVGGRIGVIVPVEFIIGFGDDVVIVSCFISAMFEQLVTTNNNNRNNRFMWGGRALVLQYNFVEHQWIFSGFSCGIALFYPDVCSRFAASQMIK